MQDNTLISEIRKYLTSHIQFALATYGQHPWIATMYYGCDPDLNIYFLTDPNSIHGNGLTKNPLVSAVIADSPQDPSGKKIGIQLYGEAYELKEDVELKLGFSIWCKTLKVKDPKYSLEGIKSGELKYRLYKLKPIKIKYYNEELWEEDEKTLNL